MDEAKLQEIEARADAATPGPWCASTGRTYDTTTGKVAHVEHYVSRGDDDVGIASDVCDSRTGEQSEPNARFIAAARTDVPDLVAEVRRLTAALDAVTTEHAAALAAARREGAEGMRAAAVAHCRRVERAAGEALGDVGRDLVRMYVGRRDGAGDCAYAIAALPLDAPGGGS